MPDSIIAERMRVPVRVIRRMRYRMRIGIVHDQWTRPLRQRRRWTPDEDALLGTAPDAAIAARLDRDRRMVARRRMERGIPAAIPKAPRRYLTADQVRMLGLEPDRVLAAQWNIPASVVTTARKARRIRACARTTPAEVDLDHPGLRPLLGTQSDALVAAATGLTEKHVRLLRCALGIPASIPKRMRPWSPDDLARLGTGPDLLVAHRIGRTREQVKAQRVRLRIPPWTEVRMVWSHERIDALLQAADVVVLAEEWCLPVRVLAVKQSALLTVGAPPLPSSP